MERLLDVSLWSADAWYWLAILLDAGVKGMIILAGAGVVCLALRQGSAATRHFLWLLALGGLVFLPVMSALLPAWQIPILPNHSAPAETLAPDHMLEIDRQEESFDSTDLADSTVFLELADQPTMPTLEPQPPSPSSVEAAPVVIETAETDEPLPWSAWVLAGWLAGMLIVSAPLAVGMVVLWRISRRCQRVSEGPLAAMSDRLSRQLGLRRRIRLLQGAAGQRLTMPIVWGAVRPAVLLPTSTGNWPTDRLRIVLLHELAHVKRWDWLTQLAAYLVRSLYWFNPLVWVAVRQLRIERERACDDLVLAGGFAASDYAGHLLDIVRELRSSRPLTAAAVAMARPSQIEKRLRAILDATRSRRALTRTAIITALLLVTCVVLPLASMQATTKTEAETESDEEIRPVTLAAVRELVLKNEALAGLIKMDYTVRFEQSGQTSESPGTTGKRRAGRRYTHYKGVWAQDGVKVYSSTNHYFSEDELARSSVRVMEGEVTREWAGRAGQMRGTIREINRSDWQDIGPYRLGIKPFEGEHLLSKALTAQYASVHEEAEAVDGREAYVIDVESPVKPAYFARMWIDRQRGMPLRIEYYDKRPTSSEARLMSKVEGIKLHQTANGGWIPVAGTRSLHFSGPSPRIAYEKVAVDVDSITIRREDIPESMFTIDFPEGTAVHNAITGWTYLHGKPVKTYEQIVQSGGKFIAGTVVDERGVPVPEVVVKIYFRTTKTADGKIKSFKIVQPHDLLNAMTDAQGRFAIEMDEDGKYDLRFLPPNHAAVIAYDVSVGTDDLKVTLPQGGTVRGRVVRMENGKKAPLGFVEVKIADKNSRSVYTTLRRYRDRKTVTDAQGRFRFDHLRTKMRAFGSKALENEEQYIPRFWTISSEGASRDIAFYEDMTIEGLELIVEPDWDHPAPLTGKPLPTLNGIQIDFDRAQAKGKSVLICFWDKDQRAGRRCITELAKKTDELKNKGITLVGVHASKVDESVLKNWLTENKITFPIGAITGDVEETLFKWGVRSQPWLILTDADHIVRAEGFPLPELDEKIKAIMEK